MNIREFYKSKIDEIAKESFNNEQKILAKGILDSVSDDLVESTYQLISQRVKTGFVFDAAPEINHDAISLVKEKTELYIDSKHEISNYVEHKLIIGENYDALKNLLVTHVDPISNEGLIDVIYIDPPYSTEMLKKDGNDYKTEVESDKFIYRDKFTRDGWLNLMNERLKLSKKLLSKNGVIFISIDDRNQAHLKLLCDEIFGEENLLNIFVWVSNLKGRQISAGGAVKTYEYILAYALDRNNVHDFNDDVTYLKDAQPSVYKMADYEVYHDDVSDYVIKNQLYNSNSAFNEETRKNLVFNIHYNPKTKEVKFSDVNEDVSVDGFVKIEPNTNNNGTHKYHAWRWSKDKIMKETNDLHFEKHDDNYRIFTKIRDYKLTNVKDLIMDIGNGGAEMRQIFGKSVFDFPKSTNLMKFLLKQFNSDIKVLDFFAGSGTTGHAVMELNEEDGGKREFILVTNNENDIAKKITHERLYRVINGIGTKGQKINWKYSNEVPSLINNKIRVFEIEQHELTINDTQKAVELVKESETQFKLLNNKYAPKSKLDIYNELSSLNPIKKVK